MLRKWTIFALILEICLVSIAVSYAETETMMLSPAEVDGGRWTNIYYEYLEARSSDVQNILLADLDIDGRPELIVLNEWGRWNDSGWIVKATEDSIIEYYSPELFPSGWTLALCLDTDGNYAWYESDFSASTGLQYTAVNRLRVTPEMEIVRSEWLGYSTEQIPNEETGEIELVNTGYYVEGERVEFDTYRLEEIKRLRLSVLFTSGSVYSFPEEWDEAIQELSVANVSR